MASQRRNRRVAFGLGLLVVGMVGLSFAAVPLYELFCRVTGLEGSGRAAAIGDLPVLDRTMAVRMTGDVDGALAWDFGPVEPLRQVRLGEPVLAYYRAASHAAGQTVGTAVFNVNPPKAAQYFVKVECFCFTEQTLAAGQITELPVYFYVDPALDQDPNLADLGTITLSYTFFESPAGGDAAAVATAQ